MLDAITVGKVIQDYWEKCGLSQEVVSGLAGIGRTHLSATPRSKHFSVLPRQWTSPQVSFYG